MTGWLTILIGAPLAAAAYVIHCAIWPYAPCRRCDGGRKPSPGGSAWRLCRRCEGTGSRVRTGRRIFDYLHGQRGDAD